MPRDWTIEYNRLQDSWVCIPTTPTEKAIYARCYEGIVFRMEFYYTSLDVALVNQSGLYRKVGNYYYTSDPAKDTIKAKNLEGPGWAGIYHKKTCNLSCKENRLHAATGECENIYFSNGKITVAIETNGRAFDDRILNMLLKSIRFY